MRNMESSIEKINKGKIFVFDKVTLISKLFNLWNVFTKHTHTAKKV